uniref:Peptidase S1 domain-containing protein n=1 Tax=Daphnia galeata TaxID=27404 RepID=A0A8J2WF73_9CRUS|nr:unnamed protein product [Daphnia galeata]
MKSALILLVLAAGAMAGKLTLPRLPLSVLMRGGWPMVDDDRIVGGTQASPNEFPYQISLRVCCISNHDILTAVGSLSIVAGEHNLAIDSGDEQIRNVLAKNEHVSYSSRTQENDICLLQLSSALTLNTKVGVVRIGAQGAQTAVGTNCVVSGWGTTSSGGSTIPDILRKVTVPTVSDDTCRGSYGTNAITDSMICAGFRLGGADSCQGDSGGPLVDEGTNLLVGIVSWGIGCADAGYYGVYTEVSYFHNWIVNIAG